MPCHISMISEAGHDNILVTLVCPSFPSAICFQQHMYRSRTFNYLIFNCFPAQVRLLFVIKLSHLNSPTQRVSVTLATTLCPSSAA